MVFIKYKYSLKYDSVNYYGFVNFLMQWLRSSWPLVIRFWPQDGHQWWPVGSNPPDEKCGCWIWWIFMVYWWSWWQQIGLICLKLFVRFQKIYEELKFSPTRWRFSRPKKTSNASKTSKKINFETFKDLSQSSSWLCTPCLIYLTLKVINSKLEYFLMT